MKRAGASFWVMPTKAEQDHNLAWLRGRSHALSATVQKRNSRLFKSEQRF